MAGSDGCDEADETDLLGGVRIPWRPRVAVGPAGLVLQRPESRLEFPWSLHRRLTKQPEAWFLATRPALEQRVSLLVYRGRKRINVGTWFAPLPHDTTVAFLTYVSMTPEAQRKVGGIPDLPGALAGLHHGPPHPRRIVTPIFCDGERVEVIIRALDAVWPRLGRSSNPIGTPGLSQRPWT